MYGINKNDKVILIWETKFDQEEAEMTLECLKMATGQQGSVSIENVEMLKTSNYSTSSFDIALAGILPPFQIKTSSELLAEVLRILKPEGRINIRTDNPANAISCLRMSGYTNITDPLDCDLTDDQKGKLLHPVKDVNASKPNFEIGSSVPLSFANKITTASNNTWKIDLTDNDVDLEDPDDLLTEEDLVKPDPTSLKVCGTTGQRKACKNCVCGLKEELEDESDQKRESSKKDVKSACGSCYLGDAFRCGSCPYLGMPAFKPGEKVKLTDSTLQDVS